MFRMTNGISALATISAIPVTPFLADGTIDEPALQTVVARIVDAGIELVVSCGNTGEYSSLSPAEAERVTAATLEAAGTVTTLVGVGGDLATAAQQARRAIDRGAAGAMIHFPSDPYVSADGLTRYYDSLLDAIDGIVVLYLRGRLPSSVLDHLVASGRITGVKYAIPDVVGFAQFAERYGDDVTLLCGLAEMWAPFFWLAGARGFTSGLVNVAPELSLAMLAALRAGDFPAAMDVWSKLKPFEDMRAREANGLNVPVVKEALALRGILPNAAVRPPIASLSDEQREELGQILASWE
jgi:4-hydroxy-tetrahydrodipicolinate synthase